MRARKRSRAAAALASLSSSGGFSAAAASAAAGALSPLPCTPPAASFSFSLFPSSLAAPLTPLAPSSLLEGSAVSLSLLAALFSLFSPPASIRPLPVSCRLLSACGCCGALAETAAPPRSLAASYACWKNYHTQYAFFIAAVPQILRAHLQLNKLNTMPLKM